jgi:exodeoxyribonuclease VII large subunit
MAIAEASTPIISAVGHETDVTISDFVADRRAETPTAAAVLVTPITVDDLLEAITEITATMTRTITTTVTDLHEMASSFLDGRAARRITERVHLRSQRVDDVTSRWSLVLRRNLGDVRRRIDHAAALAESLHPLAPLRKGYAVVERSGHVLSGTEPLTAGDTITLRRQTETSSATLTAITKTS